MKCGSCTFATEKKSKGEMGDAQLGWGGQYQLSPPKKIPKTRKENKIIERGERTQRDPTLAMLCAFAPTLKTCLPTIPFIAPSFRTSTFAPGRRF